MMASKTFLEEINGDVKDIINTKFEFTVTDAQQVPSYEHSSLTFENGVTKKGKTIETCILYVDIRNSVALNNQHQKETMGKLYTAFTKAVLSIVDYHGGSVRNIIGDRVMAVFPPKDCFTHAVDCAVSINTVATRIINHHFKLNEFKCGIGIDYGNMLVLKNGIIKQGHDRTAYKNLVWIGRPANIASRLTDIANKEVTSTRFKVYYNPYNFSRFGLGGLYGSTGNNNGPIYQNNVAIDDITDVEFAQKISWNDVLNMCYSGGKFIKFEKNEIKTKFKGILMTDEVFKGFKNANPGRDSIVKGYWTEQKNEVKDYSGKVYGGEPYWSTMDEVKI